MSALDIDATVERGGFRLAVSLSLRPGEVTAIVGPNGSGKTTLLRAIAGLLPVTTGSIRLGDAVLDDADARIFRPAAERRAGVVFQDHRLFPHLRAVDNVAFALRRQGVARTPARARAQQWLDRLGLAELGRRRPHELSGGQAQRVALARALAAEPHMLLLDEPLAALDVQTRSDVQTELARHLAGFAGPVVLVTHDPIEALLLGHRIVVLDGGRVVQDASPADVAGRPTNRYVARLVGMNLYAGQADGGRVELDGGGVLVVGDTALRGRALVAVRPSAITVHTERPGVSSARNTWPATVASFAQLADRIRIRVDGAPPALVDLTPLAVAELGLRPGGPVWLSAKATDLDVYAEPG